MTKRTGILPLLGATLVAVACGGEPEHEGLPIAAAEANPGVAADMVVYKSPTCGCCNGWIEHMREAGYTVEAVDIAAYAGLQAKKREHGVPADLGSCHTGVIDGYVIEGHVPARLVRRLLEERPDAKGLAAPGMPIGSPGMEGPGATPYDVMVFGEDGSSRVYERVDPNQPSSDAR